ncbi:MAG: thiamine pyrophosphate-dependent enzyme [Candidatus Omnitrophota bacterium]|jgi:pyruvate dehydrogenase E1 component alpha subunit
MPTKKDNKKNAREVLRLRFCQMLVNQGNKQKQFKIPVHLALGHEAIAVALASIMKENDWLLLTHRNIHYNLALSPSLKQKIAEYLCLDSGEAGGQLGCMNLYNEEKRVLYTSSILGNQMAVATGVALGNTVKKTKGVAIVVIGDGAIEEGVFQESLLMMKTYATAALIIVENNNWSLATEIHERRCDIALDRFASAFKIPYELIKGNDVFEYIPLLEKARAKALAEKTPVIIEVSLRTLGDWRMKTDEYPEGKYINYHAGAAPTVELSDWPVIEETEGDPVYVLTKHFENDFLKTLAKNVLADVRKELG